MAAAILIALHPEVGIEVVVKNGAQLLELSGAVSERMIIGLEMVLEHRSV